MNVLLALSIAIAMGLLFSRFIRFIHLPNVTAFIINQRSKARLRDLVFRKMNLICALTKIIPNGI